MIGNGICDGAVQFARRTAMAAAVAALAGCATPSDVTVGSARPQVIERLGPPMSSRFALRAEDGARREVDLGDEREAADAELGREVQRLFYISTPPSVFAPIVLCL